MDLTQSSEVVCSQHTKSVNYQVLINNHEQKISQIQEFRITSKGQGNTTQVQLAGQKWIISSKSKTYDEVVFLPLLSKSNEILGTQLLVDDEVI
jgi:hypothetical protein